MEIEKINNLKLTADDFKAIDDILYHTFRKSGGCTTDSAKNTLVALHGIIQDLVQDAFELGLGYVSDDKSEPMESLMKITPENSVSGTEFTMPVLGTESRSDRDFKKYPSLKNAMVTLSIYLSKKITYFDKQEYFVTSQSKIETVSKIYEIPFEVLKRQFDFHNKKPEDFGVVADEELKKDIPTAGSVLNTESRVYLDAKEDNKLNDALVALNIYLGKEIIVYRNDGSFPMTKTNKLETVSQLYNIPIEDLQKYTKQGR